MYQQVGQCLVATAVVVNDKRHAHNFLAALIPAGYVSTLRFFMDGNERVAVLYPAAGVTPEMVYAVLEAGEILPLPPAPSAE